MQITNLFPQPLGISNINRKFTPEEFYHILTQQRVNNPDNECSINDSLLHDEKLSNLKSDIQKNIDEYFRKVYCPSDDVEIYITQSWANYTTCGGSHYKHNHSNSFISGVLYVNVYQTDVIEFSRVKNEILNIEPTKHNIWNAENWTESVEIGKIILFPSKLIHGVPPRGDSDNSERISIAFNTFIKGKIGVRDHKTQLTLN
jgi:hypothetical protein